MNDDPASEPETLTLSATLVRQNRFEFLATRMKAADLVAISQANRIRLESLSSKRYIGIQRPLNDERVNRLAEFVVTQDGILPGTVVLSLSGEHVVGLKDGPNESTVLEFEVVDETAAIIDGQHRVAGLKKAQELLDSQHQAAAAAAKQQGKVVPERRNLLEEFEVPVVVFIDLDPADQAFIFNRINANQKPVDRSLSFELFGSAKYRSPQKSAHEIAQILNTQEDSPFYGKLKMVVGLKDEWTTGGILTQASFANELIKLYSAEKIKDEIAFLSKEESKLVLDPKLPLRGLFLSKKEAAIIRILKQYFRVIAETWPDQWRNERRNFNLSKSTGYAAWMRVLGDWLRYPAEGDQILAERFEVFRTRIRPIQAKYELPPHRFVSSNYPSNSAGQDSLRDKLLEDLGLPARPKRTRKKPSAAKVP